MSDPNLVKNKIREELRKGLPSKRKILSLLLDLFNKDKFPYLSDSEFCEIVGYTYQLNLDYKLNLDMLFFPIYNALKKKIKKLHVEEKNLEMEQYLSENFNLSYPEEKEIVQPIQDSRPSSHKILRYFFSLLLLILGIFLLISGIYVYFNSPSISFFGRGFIIVIFAIGITCVIGSILIVLR